MKNHTFIIFFSLISSYAFAQSNVVVGLDGGIGINNKLIVANKEVKNNNSLLLNLNGTYQLNIKDKAIFETGLYSQFSKNKGEIGNSKFKIQKIKIGANLLLGVKINSKFSFLAGVTVSNVPNLVQVNFRKPDNLKLDFFTKITYKISSKFDLTVKFKTLINKIGNQHLIADPKHNALMGIGYNFVRL